MDTREAGALGGAKRWAGKSKQDRVEAARRAALARWAQRTVKPPPKAAIVEEVGRAVAARERKPLPGGQRFVPPPPGLNAETVDRLAREAKAATDAGWVGRAMQARPLPRRPNHTEGCPCRECEMYRRAVAAR